ncbi:hypothetical protein Moror_9257 [Moniliophthora roreri MCA 2997]|uniref:Uncharacterized protein n=1 Tax=Moniliophthora roreri (strain MCA 2997) TaxID=1381753 RepID=V2WWK6_MONRO|nr:hypothetical protein Moror_9257 [Moniliophthora roreri MCA 2997]
MHPSSTLFQTFRRDFEQFFRLRNVNIAQLFGYNDGRLALPALILYDVLVPVTRIWERNQFSSLLYTYFEYIAGAAQISDTDVNIGELWIHPRTSAICTGPYVQYSSSNLVYTVSGFQTTTPYHEWVIGDAARFEEIQDAEAMGFATSLSIVAVDAEEDMMDID